MVRIYTVPAGTKGQTDELDTERLGCQRKKALQRVLQGLQTLVGAAGFELATLCSQSRCATRLRYAPTASILTRQSPLF